MKKLSIILSLFTVGILFSSCRQASFIAEDDVYSTGSSKVYKSDKSDASYSNYVYTKESTSGTKSAYYNPEDSILRDNQSGTVVNNYYYGNDYLYNNGWNGYAPRYRPYSVWWGWGYDPFFYSPWHYGWGMSYGWGMHYGWGYPYYGWGYNPYAWGYGYGHNPYGWGYGGYGNTIIYGNVYNNYGGGGSAGMATQNSGGYIQSGNNFKGKRPVMAGNSAPYTGPSKVKSAINAVSGNPVKVEKVSVGQASAVTQKPSVAKGGSDVQKPDIAKGANQTQVSRINTQQLTSDSKPWVPETKTRPELSTQNAVSKESDTPRLIEKGGTEVRTNTNRVEPSGTVNRPNVPATVRPNEPSRVNPNAPGNVGREPQTIQRRDNVAPQQNNQWNRGTSTPPRTAPQSTPRNNQNMSQPQRGGGSYNSSPAPSRGGSVGGGSSPSRGSSGGGSTGTSSRGGGRP